MILTQLYGGYLSMKVDKPVDARRRLSVSRSEARTVGRLTYLHGDRILVALSPRQKREICRITNLR